MKVTLSEFPPPVNRQELFLGQRTKPVLGPAFEEIIRILDNIRIMNKMIVRHLPDQYFDNLRKEWTRLEKTGIFSNVKELEKRFEQHSKNRN